MKNKVKPKYVCYPIVGKKNDFQFVSNDGIVVDDISYMTNQRYSLFSCLVTWCSLEFGETGLVEINS